MTDLKVSASYQRGVIAHFSGFKLAKLAGYKMQKTLSQPDQNNLITGPKLFLAGN